MGSILLLLINIDCSVPPYDVPFQANPTRFRYFVESARLMRLYNADLLKTIEDIATRSLAMGATRDWKDFECVLLYYRTAKVQPSGACRAMLFVLCWCTNVCRTLCT